MNSTKELSDQSLQPIVDFVKARHGSRKRLVQLFNEGLDKPVPRSSIFRWLRDDVSERVEPHYGAGLQLHVAFVKLQNEYAKKENQPKAG